MYSMAMACQTSGNSQSKECPGHNTVLLLVRSFGNVQEEAAVFKLCGGVQEFWKCTLSESSGAPYLGNAKIYGNVRERSNSTVGGASLMERAASSSSSMRYSRANNAPENLA